VWWSKSGRKDTEDRPRSVATPRGLRHAGVCGLTAGVLLGRDGHDVTVLERDPAPVPKSPDDAWDHWARTGVAQFRQPHYVLPRARHILDAELPDVRDALLAAGAFRFDALPVRHAHRNTSVARPSRAPAR